MIKIVTMVSYEDGSGMFSQSSDEVVINTDGSSEEGLAAMLIKAKELAAGQYQELLGSVMP